MGRCPCLFRKGQWEIMGRNPLFIVTSQTGRGTFPNSKSPTYINPPPSISFSWFFFLLQLPTFTSTFLISHFINPPPSIWGFITPKYVPSSPSIISCIKFYWTWSLSPPLNTTSSRHVTSVTSIPTPMWPIMSTLVSLPTTCHHPSVTNMYSSHRRHTIWASPLWLFILHLCCPLWVSSFLSIAPVHLEHLPPLQHAVTPLVFHQTCSINLHHRHHSLPHHLYDNPSCSWCRADCIRHVKRSLMCSILWRAFLLTACPIHKDWMKLLVPRPVSIHFLFLSPFPSPFLHPDHLWSHLCRQTFVLLSLLGTNCGRCGIETTPYCLKRPFYLNGLSFTCCCF